MRQHIHCSILLAIFGLTIGWNVALSMAQDSSRVIAKLGQQSITEHEVDFQLGRHRINAAGEPVTPLELSPATLQTSIHLIAQQRQALQTLRVKKLAASREEVDAWLEQNAQPPDGTKLKAADIVGIQSKLAQITEDRFLEHIYFRLSWQRYLTQQLTEKNIAKHFENQKKRFDGTRFRVSTLAVAAPAGESAKRKSMTDKLVAARGSLTQESKNEEVDKKPESDILIPVDQVIVEADRWVVGVGDLDPAVVSALIKMKPGEVSAPIHAPTAIYLVKLIELEAGERGLEEAKDEVRAHMLLYLLDFLANQSKKQLPLVVAEPK